MEHFKDIGEKNPMLDTMFSDHSLYNEKSYPLLGLDNDAIPDLPAWKVGKDYKIIIQVKLKKKIEKEQGKVDGDFQILTVKSEEEYPELTPEQEHYKYLLE